MSGRDDLYNDGSDQQKKDLTVGVENSEIEPATDPAAGNIVDDSIVSPDSTTAESIEVTEDIAGQGIGVGEVRAVEPPPKEKSSSALLVVLLLLLVLFAGGYYLLNGGLGPAQQADIRSVVEPTRYAIDKNVKVEVVEQKQVAAVAVVKPKVSSPATVIAEPPAGTPPEKQAEKLVLAAEKVLPPVPKASEYQVLVGPYLKKASLNNAAQQLKELGLGVEVTKGRGPVAMTRLLEGIYLRDEGRERIKVIKKQVGDAFMLPVGDKLALYVGSFTDPDRATDYAQTLAAKGVNVTSVTSDVELNGKMLIAIQGEQQAAQKVVAQVKAVGLPAQVKKK